MNARSSITVYQDRLKQNAKLLWSRSGEKPLIPMIKADAYGHGADFAARTLIQLPKKMIAGLGVATFREALFLRNQVPEAHHVPVLVFSDSSPWSLEKLKMCQRFHLEPVFYEHESLLEFFKQQKSRSSTVSVPYHLEWNTGMNRLGLDPAFIQVLLTKVKTFPPPRSSFTHLALAESPNHALTRLQLKTWIELQKNLKNAFPLMQTHFQNSAAIWNQEKFQSVQADWVRPGLSLYGIAPFEKAKQADQLKRVMEWSAPVIQKRFIRKGEKVGYGGTFQAKKELLLYTLASGYADGVDRTFSNQGFVESRVGRLHFAGRVSMDLITVYSAKKTKKELQIGERVEFWGPKVDPYELAHLAQTIPYEITTRLGVRVERESKVNS